MKELNGFKKIVLAVDGSDKSKKAAKKAFFLAKKANINLTAIHVYTVPTNLYPAPPIKSTPHTSSEYVGNISKEMEKKGEAILNDIEDMGSDVGVKIKKHLAEGISDDEIIKYANKNDLIVMGSKGHSTLGRILVGSVSEKVLHHSDATVMLVR